MFYKKYTHITSRTRYSKQIRQKGNGYIPIVIDSYDIDISKSLNMCLKNEDSCRRQNLEDCTSNDIANSVRHNLSVHNYIYGVEIPFYIDSTIEDLKKYIYVNEYIHDYIHNIKKYDLVLYESKLDNESIHQNIILKNNDIIGNLYKQYKDKDDNILYIYLLKSKSNIIVNVVGNCNVS